jgi:hypothetical protein
LGAKQAQLFRAAERLSLHILAVNGKVVQPGTAGLALLPSAWKQTQIETKFYNFLGVIQIQVETRIAF